MESTDKIPWTWIPPDIIPLVKSLVQNPLHPRTKSSVLWGNKIDLWEIKIRSIVRYWYRCLASLTVVRYELLLIDWLIDWLIDVMFIVTCAVISLSVVVVIYRGAAYSYRCSWRHAYTCDVIPAGYGLCHVNSVEVFKRLVTEGCQVYRRPDVSAADHHIHRSTQESSRRKLAVSVVGPQRPRISNIPSDLR